MILLERTNVQKMCKLRKFNINLIIKDFAIVKKALDVRKLICPKSRTENNRDENISKNIRVEGIKN